MSDRAEFLTHICAEPDEDTHRLVYADWLDEQPTTKVCPNCGGRGEVRGDGFFRAGKPCRTCGGKSLTPHSHRKGTGTVPDTGDRDRAELIRVQCELSRFEEKVTDADRAEEWWALKRRSKQLRTAHPEWSKCPCPACGGSGYEVTGGGDSFDCRTCGGTGDLFRDGSLEVVGGASRVLDWHAGWPDALSCTLAEAGAERVEEPWEKGEPVRRWVPSAWARAVVAAVPVTRLVPSDKRPFRFIDDPTKFGWSRERPTYREHPAEALPPAVWDAVFATLTPTEANVFDSREAAVDVLARTLAVLARNS